MTDPNIRLETGEKEFPVPTSLVSLLPPKTFREVRTQLKPEGRRGLTCIRWMGYCDYVRVRSNCFFNYAGLRSMEVQRMVEYIGRASVPVLCAHAARDFTF